MIFNDRAKECGFPLDFDELQSKDQGAHGERKTALRYNIDLDLNPGLPSIVSEYYGPHTFVDAKQSALARLVEWREESLTQMEEECPSEKVEGRRRVIVAVYTVYRHTVNDWCRDDVDRKEQDAIASPLTALLQVLPRNRRRAVFSEIMEAVCCLDSADLERLSDLIAKTSDADSDTLPEVDGNF